jgi:SAM-dependent methyltransferase
MDWQEKTIQTYDTSADALAQYFAGHGARTDDIDRALELAGAGTDARVVEIGCGDGRDAAEIIPKVGWYEGFDPSQGMLQIARRKLPKASFVEADALRYDFPENLDVVFAFASLLHVNRRDFTAVSQKVGAALRPGGIFYLELQERDTYQEELQTEPFGPRMFYFYNPQVVEDIAGMSFSATHEDHYAIGSKHWFTLALQKV